MLEGASGVMCAGESVDSIFERIFPESQRLAAFGMAFDDLAAFEAAGHAREAIGKLSTYGFVTFSGLRKLLKAAVMKLRRDASHVVDGEDSLASNLAGFRFLDLGSGEGRCVIGAALLGGGRLSESRGIELSTLRHDLAIKKQTELPEGILSETALVFDRCDILETDAAALASADIVYLSNLHFPDEVSDSIETLLERHCCQKPFVLTSLRALRKFSGRTVEQWTETVSMSWSPGWPVYCYLLAPASSDSSQEGA